jgi:fructosamine-3-kinase
VRHTTALSSALATALDREVVDLRPVGGGMNEAFRAELAGDDRVFVKTHASPPSNYFAVEADGLAWLAQADALRVPRVLAWSDEEPGFLALEWIERGPGQPRSDADLGRGLAALHRTGASTFGWHRDGYVGSLPQANAPVARWSDFYRDRRIEPLVRQAVDRGLLPGTARATADRLLAALDDLVGPDEPPARLHGDLWQGNAVVDADGRPWLVDPAPYGGHREVDLAMMRLFGGFDEACFAAYDDAHPLADGHRERVPLYQLYPLLVHVLLFGASYASRALAAMARYS